jgi:oxygen-independent coproporphyrinogen-3 oxidase
MAGLNSQVSRVSADLIYGTFDQSPEAAGKEAAALASSGATHLSAYGLTIEPGTRFGALHRKGQLPLLDEMASAQAFTAVSDALTAVGLDHYEVSNFCRGRNHSRHNLTYWLGRDYLGLGAGAWGTLTEPSGHGIRYRNTLAPERYLGQQRWTRVFGPTDPEKDIGLPHEHLTPETRLTERLLLGLRLRSGVDPTQLESALGVEVQTPERLRAAERLERRGRLTVTEGRWRIPRSAWLFADSIIAELA